MRLQNKITLITGAAQGIGKAIAELFYKEGAYVIATDILDDKGNDLVQSLGPKAEYVHLNVKREDDWRKTTNYLLAKYSKLDVLVNNAGITGFMETRGPYDAETIDLNSWEEIHRVNAGGVMLGCKYGISMMKQRGGSIINMSSRSGMVGIPAAVGYASSKAAVRNHTKSVALYCAERGYNIRCNSIHPAAIMTPMWEPMLASGTEREQAVKQIASGVPLGRFGEPVDVAYGALYLASDESKYVTGIELTIDGGVLAGSHASPSYK